MSLIQCDHTCLCRHSCIFAGNGHPFNAPTHRLEQYMSHLQSSSGVASQELRGQAEAGAEELSYIAATCLLRGHAFAALENHARALRCYRTALQADPLCYEAFQVLHHPHLTHPPSLSYTFASSGRCQTLAILYFRLSTATVLDLYPWMNRSCLSYSFYIR